MKSPCSCILPTILQLFNDDGRGPPAPLQEQEQVIVQEWSQWFHPVEDAGLEQEEGDDAVAAARDAPAAPAASRVSSPLPTGSFFHHPPLPHKTPTPTTTTGGAGGETYFYYPHQEEDAAAAARGARRLVTPTFDRHPLETAETTTYPSPPPRAHCNEEEVLPGGEDTFFVLSTTPRNPTHKDVLAERGSASNKHTIAHDFYWMHILAIRSEYLRLVGIRNTAEIRQQKKQVARKVAVAIFKNGGRFLTRENKKSHWRDMNEDAFLEKIQTALREEKNIPKSMREYAKINHPDVYNRFCDLQESIKKKKESKVVTSPKRPPSKKNITKAPRKKKAVLQETRVQLAAMGPTIPTTLKVHHVTEFGGGGGDGILKELSSNRKLPSRGGHCRDKPKEIVELSLGGRESLDERENDLVPDDVRTETSANVHMASVLVTEGSAVQPFAHDAERRLQVDGGGDLEIEHHEASPLWSPDSFF